MTTMIAVIEKDPEILSVVDRARALTISTPEQASYVDEFCVWLKDLEKRTIAKYSDSKKKAHDAWKAVVAMESEDLDKVIEARKIAKGSLIAWSDSERVRAEQEAAIARAKAKQQAEDEALARAARAAEFGDDKAADAIMAAPVVVEPVKAYEKPKMATTMQTRWEAVVENVALIPREYLTPDMPMLNGIARSTKGAIAIPGVRFVSRKV